MNKCTILSKYTEKRDKDTVRCCLCPHYCLIKINKSGICKTRINSNGQLFSIAYGNLCSVSIDPVEKKPLFHFHPGKSIFSLATAGCNFRCVNCQNWQISQTSPSERNNADLSPNEVINRAIDYQTDMIAFTYTEPTVFYEYMFDTAKLAHDKGLKTVMISNGYINEKPLLDLIPYLDAANIDLKCFDDSTYLKLTGGHLQPVLDTLKLLKRQKVWLEITNLMIPGYNDDSAQIEKMCRWLVDNGFSDTPLHFSRYYPNYKLMVPPTEESALLNAKNIAEYSGMKYVYIGNTSSAQHENTVCPCCGKTLIIRKGFIVLEKHISENSCSLCGAYISGIWD